MEWYINQALNECFHTRNMHACQEKKLIICSRLDQSRVKLIDLSYKTIHSRWKGIYKSKLYGRIVNKGYDY